jgi:hypothetical protein
LSPTNLVVTEPRNRLEGVLNRIGGRLPQNVPSDTHTLSLDSNATSIWLSIPHVGVSDTTASATHWVDNAAVRFVAQIQFALCKQEVVAALEEEETRPVRFSLDSILRTQSSRIPVALNPDVFSESDFEELARLRQGRGDTIGRPRRSLRRVPLE